MEYTDYYYGHANLSFVDLPKLLDEANGLDVTVYLSTIDCTFVLGDMYRGVELG